MKKSKETSNLEKVGIRLLFIVIIFMWIYVGYEQNSNKEEILEISYELSNIPEYNGKSYVVINNNNPNFSQEDMQLNEYYSNVENNRVRNGYDKN